MAGSESGSARSIIAPLDGSDMGQFAAPYIAACARALGLHVTVARIVEGGAWQTGDSGYLLAPSAYKQAQDAVMESANADVQRICDWLGAVGVTAQPAVKNGSARDELVRLEAESDAPLTVMATHARTGLARIAFGSIADYIVRYGTCPVLLVRAMGPLIESPALERALIPLDGSTASERAFDTLSTLAGSLIRRVTLLRVIDPDDPAGASQQAATDLESARARALQRVGERGVTVDVAIHWGTPAAQILRASGEHDLVLMTTHGATGPARWALGSVSDEVVHTSIRPVIITRLPQVRG
ncbi:MAG TPA: universal stress protein [Ktedonobacterales bacterium]